MKLVIFTCGLLAIEISASVESLNAAFANLVAKDGNATTRSLGRTPLSIFSSFADYGCWCRLSMETHGNGHSLPVNEYDQACKEYHQGVECLMDDFGFECNPWESSYNDVIDQEQCASFNNGDCSIALCQVEQELVSKLFYLAFTVAAPADHQLYNPTHDRYDSTWTTEEGCAVPKLNAQHEEACCGRFPSRRPFRTMVSIDGELIHERGCCVNENESSESIFNKKFKECCEDGIVRAIGGCSEELL